MTEDDSGPRSLTQMVREFDDATVRELLIARPDLAVPEPATFSQVASRATTRESVRAALDTLNAVELRVAAAAARASTPVGPADISGFDEDTTGAALDRLRRLGLLWGGSNSLRPVRALAGELPEPVGPVPTPDPPDLGEVTHQDPERVDTVAAGSAFELVRRIEVLVEHTDHSALQLRQDGGLAQRETRTIATLLDLPAPIAALHVQIAQAAELIGVLAMTRADALLPTVACDAWRGRELSDQWAWLARGWRDAHPPSGRAPFKQLTLAAFGAPGEGRVLTAAQVQRWLEWQRPRLAAEWGRRVETMLDQAGWVGITGLGALSSFGLVDDLSALERRLPAREDTVLLQNDLTAVAPGPLTPYAAKELSALADVESRGGATVYRFTLESLRRASVSGWTSEQIRAVLEQRSRTPIPQPLSYLIADLDRSRAVAAIMAQHEKPRPPVARHPTIRATATPLSSPGEVPRLDADDAERIVHMLRRAAGPGGDEAASQAVAAEGMADSPLQTLREAVETRELVWIGYVDADGSPAERLVYATSVEEGRLVARTSRDDKAISVSVHRITAAHIIRGHSL